MVVTCHAGHLCIEAEGPAPELLPVRNLRCMPAHAHAAPAANGAAPSTSGRSEPGSDHAAAAALHARAAPAAPGQAQSAASGSEQGGRQAGAPAGLQAAGPDPASAAGKPPGGPGGLVLSWQAPERCTRCEVWARRDPGPPGLRGPASAADDGGRHRLEALGGGPASAADPVQHHMANASGARASRLRESEHPERPDAHCAHEQLSVGHELRESDPPERPDAYCAHEQVSVEHKQPDRPEGGASLAAENRRGVYGSVSCDGWTWLGTAHTQRFWVARTLLDPGDRGWELAVQARDGAGRALPLLSCPRVRAPAV